MSKNRKEPSIHLILSPDPKRSSVKNTESLQSMEKFFSYGGGGVLRAYASVILAYALKKAEKDAISLSALWRVEKSPEGKFRVLSQYLRENLGIEVSPEEIGEILGKNKKTPQKKEQSLREESLNPETPPSEPQTPPKPQSQEKQPEKREESPTITEKPKESPNKAEEGEFWGDGEVKPAF